MNSETFASIVDILLVSFLNYRILVLVRGPRAWQMVVGAFFVLSILLLSKVFKLYALEVVLDRALLLAPVAIVILLLPELRKALEVFGKVGLWGPRLAAYENAGFASIVDSIVEAATSLSEQRTGALIVIERGAPLADTIDNGLTLDAKVTAPLLESIFFDGSPLHDGAAIIRGDRVVAAACRLPFSENQSLSKSMHMRHRAAVGISEVVDCSAVVVSEERGTISYAEGGSIRVVSAEQLRSILLGTVKSARKPGLKLRSRRESHAEKAG